MQGIEFAINAACQDTKRALQPAANRSDGLLIVRFPALQCPDCPIEEMQQQTIETLKARGQMHACMHALVQLHCCTVRASESLVISVLWYVQVQGLQLGASGSASRTEPCSAFGALPRCPALLTFERTPHSCRRRRRLMLPPLAATHPPPAHWATPECLAGAARGCPGSRGGLSSGGAAAKWASVVCLAA